MSQPTDRMANLTQDTLQKMLAAAEELKLPEGEYLTLANVLRDEFNKVKPEKVVLKRKALKTKVKFFSEKGRKALEIEVRERVEYKMSGSTRFADEYRLAVNGVEEELTGMWDTAKRAARLYRLNRTTAMELDGFRMTLEEFNTQMNEEYKARGMEDEGDWNMEFLMANVLDIQNDL